MATLRAQLGIPVDQLVQVKIRAHNPNGWGQQSEANIYGATMETQPGKMGAILLDSSYPATNNTQLTIYWTPLQPGIQTGGTNVSIDSYQVYWDVSGTQTYLATTTLTSYSQSVLSSGVTYKFYVRAVNKYGPGNFSDPYSFKTGQAPDKPNSPILSISGIYIKIDFSASIPSISSTNNFAIDQFQILILDQTDNPKESKTYCDGSSLAIMIQQYCLIPMRALRVTPFELAQGKKIYAQIVAHNQRGWSANSDSNINTIGPTVQTEPKKMNPPTLSATFNSIQLLWNDITLNSLENGGSSIISYIVYWDKGTATWAELLGETSFFTDITYTISTGIVSGNTYNFKIKAENIWGTGEFSDVTTIIAQSTPAQMSAPTTSIDSTTGSVIISWIAPSANGDPITSYTILIKDHSGNPLPDTTNCNGASSPVKTNLKCTIPMSVLTSTFALVQGEYVYATVSATNSKGTGTTSPYNSGTTKVAVAPVIAPTLSKGAFSSSTYITLSWSPLINTDTGGSDITSYKITWDGGSGGSFTLMDSLVTSYLVTGLQPGTTYNFRIQAKNVYGSGPNSTPDLTIIAQDVPATMSPPTVTRVTTNMLVDWSALTTVNNGDGINEYTIQIFNPTTSAYSVDTTNCNGASGAIVLAAKCPIPIATLISSYGYNYGNMLQVRIRAHNTLGYGGYSSNNVVGDILKGTPTYMNPPTMSSFTASSVVLVWNPITTNAQTGADTILSYLVEYRIGTGAYNILRGDNPDDATTTYSHTSLTAGITYEYRLTARNSFGLGTPSATASFTPQAVPNKMSIVTTEYSGVNLKISWSIPTINGASITEYEIVIKKKTGTTYIEDTVNCDGSNLVIMGQHYCLIPMSTFTSSPYSYTQGDTIYIKARARNINGWGDYSDPNALGSPLAMTIPTVMNTPTKEALTTSTQIDLKWLPLTLDADTGGSPIISYNLQWDAGTLGVTWTNILGYSPASLATSTLLTSSITPGSTYRFRVRAQNIFGWGDFSTEKSILAATLPGQVSTPTTSIDSATGGIKISWTQPSAGGLTIDKYLIEIALTTAASAFDTSTYCDGTSQTVITNLYCIIPMSILVTNGVTYPFAYNFQEVVKAQVTAHNSLGYGTTSSINSSGAQIRRIPGQVGLPTITSNSDSAITITWPALTSSADIGDSPITSYELKWDNGLNVDPTITLTNSLVTSFTVSGGLTAGTSYKFKVRAYNIYGPSDTYSTTVPATATDSPTKMSIPVLTPSGTNVIITISQPDYHGAAISSYQFLILKSNGAYGDASSLCAETQADIILTSQCTMTMASIKTFTSLAVDQKIIVKVTATNSRGTSVASEVNTSGPTIETKPSAMTSLSFNAATSTNTKIVLTWSTPTGVDAGGSFVPLTGYTIQYDDGNGAAITTNTVTALAAATSLDITPLLAGKTYKFQISATNKYGSSTFAPTTPLSIVTGQKPEQPDKPTTTISSMYVRIYWDIPTFNNVAIDKYLINIQRGDGNFYPDTTYCDGSSSTVVSNHYCQIPMSVLQASPYSLEQGDIVTAAVTAHNARGWSLESDPNDIGASVQTAPHKMAKVTKNALTSNSQIKIDWVAPDDGGSSIISYIVYWDKGTATWAELLGETSFFTDITYTISTGIVSGNTYNFKIKAENIWGTGEFSDVTTIIAQSTPAQMSAPTTSIDSTTGSVIISWIAPSANGDPITSYTILIKDHSGNPLPDTTNCNGASSPVKTNLKCTIPMSVLTSTFALVQGEYVYATVSATNSKGTGTTSPYNSGTTKVAVAPVIAPTLSKGAFSSSTYITLSWSPLINTDTGGSDITSYKITWDGGSGGSFTLMDSLVTSYLVTGLQPGTTYNFRIQAKNVYGSGPNSTPDLTIIAQDVPATMSPPTVTRVTTNMLVDWSALTTVNNGDGINEYTIQIFNPTTSAYSVDTTNCNGASGAIVLAAKCPIPIATLISSYGYNYGNMLQVRIRAHNTLGYGGYSSNNVVGDILKGTPTYMNPPTMSSFTASSVVLVWNPITTNAQTGADTILSYLVEYRIGTGAYNILRGDNPDDATTTYSHTSLTAGITYEYRLTARNSFGLGTPSATASFTPQAVPNKMSIVTTEYSGVNLKISWSIPTINGASITEYEIVIKKKTGTTYIEDTVNCDGSNLVIMGQHYCLIPMSTFTSSPYSYTQGDTIYIKARARNINGWGDYSDPNALGSPLAMTIPTVMNTPTKEALTTSTQIDLKWLPLTLDADTGGSPIISYNLQWDAGTLGVTWTNILGYSPASLATSTLLTSSITPGSTYRFRVRAQNIFGWGDFSTEKSILAATLPGQVSTPTTSIDSATGGIKISWTQPSAGGLTIDKYLIEIALTTAASAFDTSTYCDGTSQTVITNLYCIIPMSILVTNGVTYPFAYNFQEVVKAQVTAHNSLGYGTTSSINSSGAQIRRIPGQVGLPTITSNSDSAITITWPALTSSADIGDSPITSYELKWDNGLNVDPTITLTNSLVTSFTVSGGLTAGTSYKFKVRAYNIYGPSDTYSTTVPATATDSPTKMSIPVLTPSGTNVIITISQPDYHGAAISSYQFLILKSNGAYGDASSLCAETQADIILTSQCTMTMASIKTFTSLAVDQKIIVKVTATNSRGTSVASEVNTSGPTIETKPSAMTSLSFNAATSTNTKIVLTWSTPTGVDAGGSFVPLTGYTIQYDDGNGAAITTNTVTALAAATSLDITPLLAGKTYKFQISATNKYGSSTFAPTTPLSIVTGQKPEQPDKPTTTISSMYVRIYWDIPTFNNVAIDKYLINIQRGDGNFYPDTTYCDGSSSTVVSNHYCQIPMSVLQASPYSLEQGDIVTAAVTAHNARGWSLESDPNDIGASVQTAPHKMAKVTKNALTSNSQIKIDWVAPDDGGSSIISYGIEWDSGTNGVTFSELVGETSNYLDTTYAFSTSNMAGKTYQFKIKALNQWGWSFLFSPITSILAASPPSIVTGVVTSIDSLTGGVKIAWTSPSNNGATITSYTIQIMDKNGDWQTDSNCVGTDNTVKTNLYCIVPMANLISAPFLLSYGDLIKVQINAVNSLNSGAFSTINSQTSVRWIPKSENSIITVVSYSATQIVLQWNSLISAYETGNSAITSYNLYWNQGSGSIFVQLTNSLVLTKTINGLTAGTTYQFYLRAQNIYGQGVKSPTVSIATQDVPSIMSTLTTTFVGTTQIKVAWVAPASNGDTIDKYLVKIYNAGTGLYVEDITNCDGSSSPAKTNMYCLFSISYLISQYSYQVGDLVKFIASAHNSFGWSIPSSENSSGETIQTLPATMNAPYSGSLSSASQIQVSWVPLTTKIQTGGSSIQSYELSWNGGSGSTFTVLVGFSSDYTGTSYIVSSPTIGNSYKFYLRAKNSLSWGPYSNTVTIIPSDIPLQTPVAVTSIVNNYVKIEWTNPSNRGSPITAYDILIKKQSGGYIPELTYCDGSNSVVKSYLYCMIPMTVLSASPFSLNTYGQIIYVKIASYNTNGWGAYSTPNTGGATIETVPVQMALPTKGSSTTQTQIEVIWTQLTATQDIGGTTAAIISYNLQWDSGLGGGFTDLTGISSSFTSTSYIQTNGVSSGNTYKFKVRAKNKYGWGLESSVLTVLTGTTPDAPINVATSVSGANVVITWTPQSNNGQVITSYDIEVYKNDLINFAPAQSYCVESTSTIILLSQCTVPLTTLRGAPWSLVYDKLVKVKIAAQNVLGLGSYSTPNSIGAQIVTEPVSPPVSILSGSNTNDLQIEIIWDELTVGLDSGGLTITGYDIYWGAGNPATSWALLYQDRSPFLKTKLITTGISSGTAYQFKYLAINSLGSSTFSAVTTITSTAVPDQLATASTVNSGTNVDISWPATLDYHGSPVTSYVIEFLKKNGAYQEYLPTCNGANNGIFNARSCSVPITIFSKAPYLLNVGDTVQVRVKAVNSAGPSIPSTLNGSGATVYSEPIVGPTPTQGASTTFSSVQINWSPISASDNGGSVVTDYGITWDQGTNTWTTLTSTTGGATTYTYSIGIQPNTHYLFKVFAINYYGNGQESSTALDILTPGTVPAQLDTVAITITGGNAIISWSTSPNTYGSPVTSYFIEFEQNDGTYSAYTTTCDGSIDPVFSALSCTVPESVFLASPYSLSPGDLIIAQVSALNSYGWSTPSIPNSSVTIV